MEIDQFRSALRTRSFRPFTLMTADGEKHTVTHPETVAITPSGRTVVLVDEKGLTVIDMVSITKFAISRTRAPKRGSVGV